MTGYRKITLMNLEPAVTEWVDAEHVKNYVEAVDFFRDLGGFEAIRKGRGGHIACTSISPDGLIRKRVSFTPTERCRESVETDECSAGHDACMNVWTP